MERAMIRLHGVSFSYDGRRPVLHEIDHTIKSGLTLLVGPNGCGKSTFSKLTSGIERPDTGVIEVNGRELWKDEVPAREGLAYVPEHPDLSPYATVSEILRLVCSLRGEPLSSATDLLDRVGLGAHRGDSVRELSAGQRRRVTIAAAMIGRTNTLILDEPLETLDRVMRDDMLAWVGQRRRAGAVVLVVTHEVEPFLEQTDHVFSIKDGRVVEAGSLPDDTAGRFGIVDRLARGVD